VSLIEWFLLCKNAAEIITQPGIFHHGACGFNLPKFSSAINAPRCLYFILKNRSPTFVAKATDELI
jgi:hypothetical protein